jgi:hypothetical protein
MRLPIAAKASVRADVRVTATVAAPVVAVPLDNAPVPEFFGVPLDNVQDVVFVLDCSGSMSEIATGAIAQLHTQPAPPPPPPPADTSTAPGGVTVGPAEPPPPPPDPNGPPPPDPNAPQPVSSNHTDNTGAAGPRKIDVAQEELASALQRLAPGTRLNVIFFNGDLEAFAPSIVPVDEQGKSTLIQFVRGTSPDGGTALAPAMRAAFLMNAARVVLLSDGLGNIGGTPEDIIRDAREAIRGGVRIDTIGLGAGQAASLLSTLASESGGLYQAL